jgi:hypothetical protein
LLKGWVGPADQKPPPIDDLQQYHPLAHAALNGSYDAVEYIMSVRKDEVLNSFESLKGPYFSKTLDKQFIHKTKLNVSCCILLWLDLCWSIQQRIKRSFHYFLRCTTDIFILQRVFLSSNSIMISIFKRFGKTTGLF